MTVPNSVTSIGAYAFSECYSLTEIIFEGGAPEIGSDCFGDCFSAVAATAYYPADNPTWTEEKLQDYGGTLTWVAYRILASGTCGAESDGTNLTWALDDMGRLTISGDGAMASFELEAAPWYSYRDYIKTVQIESGVTVLGRCAFYNCNALTAVTIPDGVATIQERAFENCTALTFVSIPEGVTTIGVRAFAGSSSLEEVTLPSTLTGELRAFSDCSSLKAVEIPYGVTTVGGFAYCYALESVTIPNSVTTIQGYGFEYCTALTSITIPDSVTVIGLQAFDHCTAMTNAFLGSGVTFMGDEGYMDGTPFYMCSSLSQIEVSEQNQSLCNDEYGVLYTKDKTNLVCFPAGSPLTHYTCADTVEMISNSAFGVPQNLHSVEFPKSLKEIDWFAVVGCKNMTVTFAGNAPLLDRGSFTNCTVTAYYPAKNKTWTEDKFEHFESDITWVPYTKDMVCHTRVSMDTIPQDEFDLDITVARLGDSANDVAMISLYSSEGKYLETVLWQLTDDAVQTYTLSRNNTDGKIGRIRVFILDGLADPMPLANSAEI